MFQEINIFIGCQPFFSNYISITLPHISPPSDFITFYRLIIKAFRVKKYLSSIFLAKPCRYCKG